MSGILRRQKSCSLALSFNLFFITTPTTTTLYNIDVVYDDDSRNLNS